MTLNAKAIKSMKAVRDPPGLIEQPGLLESQAETLFFAERVLMAR